VTHELDTIETNNKKELQRTHQIMGFNHDKNKYVVVGIFEF
jgi:hypothetical protein